MSAVKVEPAAKQALRAPHLSPVPDSSSDGTIHPSLFEAWHPIFRLVGLLTQPVIAVPNGLFTSKRGELDAWIPVKVPYGTFRDRPTICPYRKSYTFTVLLHVAFSED